MPGRGRHGAPSQGLFDSLGIQTLLGVSGPIGGVIEQLRQGTLTGGQSLCHPGSGKGYGLDKMQCEHPQ